LPRRFSPQPLLFMHRFHSKLNIHEIHLQFRGLTNHLSDPTSGGLTCATPNGVYCAGDSLKQTIIVHCKDSVGVASCCTAELSSLPPLGLKSAARCFQTSTVSADAACSINGTVYPQSGSPFALPAPVKVTTPVPAVVSFGDVLPKNCSCANSTHPTLPTAPVTPPTSPLPPVSPVTPVTTPVQPVVPPPYKPTGWSSYPSGTTAPIPSHSPKSTLASGWSPKPTPTPAPSTSSSTTPAKPVYTAAAPGRTVPSLVLALGLAVFLL
jgi:hypothetical protein